MSYSSINTGMCSTSAILVAAGLMIGISATRADTPQYASWRSLPHPADRQAATVRLSLQNEDGAAELPAHLQRRVVDYRTNAKAGTVVVDTSKTYLYLVLQDGRAIRYGIGVGRAGFTWSGVQRISRKAEWPDWIPPADMIRRQPYLPRFVAGGPGNPLGARALYLGGTAYRIHGTNAPETIGKRVSSGCIRMLNADVTDLYNRVALGATVIVLPARHSISDVAERRIASARN
jgi:lipoprotein-anchoring transpeptidase ErfK/SrfK